jgi:hypothetical protein
MVMVVPLRKKMGGIALGGGILNPPVPPLRQVELVKLRDWYCGLAVTYWGTLLVNLRLEK